MTRFQTQLAPLESLEQVLPHLVQNLSLGRARIAIDQLNGVLQAKSLNQIVFVTASESDSFESPVAAAIAIRQTNSGSSPACDMATIVHAGFLKQTHGENDAGENDAGEQDTSDIIQALSMTVDSELHNRGTRFLQWPTDQFDTQDDSVSRWCRGFGFQSIGTLDYLSGPAAPAAHSPLVSGENHALRFEPIDWDRSGELQRFAALTERTYAQTLDCPRLAAFRTVAQTLSGYQASGAFDANCWFTVSERDGAPIGCMVLAVHRPESSAPCEQPAVLEIVYMGLVPESRGMGRGRILVQRAFQAASDVGADRVILAVDQKNAPARAIYELAGLQSMLHETVWVKSLSRAN